MSTTGRGKFGVYSSDSIVRVSPIDGLYRAASGITVTAWTAKTGGTQLTDLLDAGEQPVTEVVSTTGGQYEFWGPPTVLALWVDAGGPERELVMSAEALLEVGAQVAVATQKAADAETARAAAVAAKNAAQGIALVNALIFS